MGVRWSELGGEGWRAPGKRVEEDGCSQIGGQPRVRAHPRDGPGVNPREAQGPPTCSSTRRGAAWGLLGWGVLQLRGVGRVPRGMPVLRDAKQVPPLAPCTRTPVYSEDPRRRSCPGPAVSVAPGPLGPPASAALGAGLDSHVLRAASRGLGPSPPALPAPVSLWP